jgi:hypothetical protein
MAKWAHPTTTRQASSRSKHKVRNKCYFVVHILLCFFFLTSLAITVLGVTLLLRRPRCRRKLTHNSFLRHSGRRSATSGSVIDALKRGDFWHTHGGRPLCSELFRAAAVNWWVALRNGGKNMFLSLLFFAGIVLACVTLGLYPKAADATQVK